MIPAHIEHVFKALDRIERREPQQPMPVYPALVEGSSTTAGPGTAGAGISARCKACGAPMYALYDTCTQCLVTQTPVYPVTCGARYYDAASRILEDELGLHTHDNADELGHVIQKWIEETRNNWEPR